MNKNKVLSGADAIATTATEPVLLKQYKLLGAVIDAPWATRLDHKITRHVIERYYARFANSRVSLRYLEQATGAERNKIIPSLRRIIENGVIRIVRQGIGTRPTEYDLNFEFGKKLVSGALEGTSTSGALQGTSSGAREGTSTAASGALEGTQTYLRNMPTGMLTVGMNEDAPAVPAAPPVSDVNADTAASVVDPGDKSNPFEELWAFFPRKHHRAKAKAAYKAPRERWLTRSEAAKLLWTCWRYRETQTVHIGRLKGQKIETDKRPKRHVARFILIGLYTGTRAGAIATASPYRAVGKSFVDLETGIFNRHAVGRRASTKRQTPVPLPHRLLAHMRRWARLGIAKSHFVEWGGKPVSSVKTGFGSAVRIAGLDVTMGNVTPHTLRHTAATWLMQRAAPMWEAAGFLGMSEKTLRDTYGHHHPDHLRGAAGAIGSRPAPPKKVALVVSLVQEKTKRARAVQAPEIAGGPGRTRTSNQTVMSGRL
jgi:integrase